MREINIYANKQTAMKNHFPYGDDNCFACKTFSAHLMRNVLQDVFINQKWKTFDRAHKTITLFHAVTYIAMLLPPSIETDLCPTLEVYRTRFLNCSSNKFTRQYNSLPHLSE